MTQLMYFVPATGSPFTPSVVAGTTITVSSTSNLLSGMYVENSTFGINTTISSITNLTQFVVASATGITTSTPLNIGTWVTAVVGSQGSQGPQGANGLPSYVLTNVTAAGTTQGTAAALSFQYNTVTGATATTNNGSGTGVILPVITTAGQIVFVDNASSNWLLIYPATGAAIDAATTNTAVWLAPRGTWLGVAGTTTLWASFVPSLNTDSTGQVVVTYTNGQTTFGLGTVATSSGGTGTTTSPSIGVFPYGASTTALAYLAANTTTTPQFVTSTGTGSAAQAPTLTTSTGSGSVVLATSPTLTTPALGTPSAVVLSNATSVPVNQATGTLAVGNGGTGTTSAPAVGSIPLGSSTSAYTPLAIGTAGQYLVVNPGGTTAEWRTLAAGTPATASQAAATLTAGSANIVSGSLIQLPTSDLTVGSRFKFTMGLTKTGAGTNTWKADVKFGTAGTTSDATIATFTSGTNTGIADQALLTITVNVLTTGSSATANCLAFYSNSYGTATTGLGSLGATPGTTATFNSGATTPYFHIDITPGSSAVMTAWCETERLA